LEQIIFKALEKDRDVRCQTAGELRADLKRLRRDLDSGKSTSVAAVSGSSPVASAAASSVSAPVASSATVATRASRRRIGPWIVLAVLTLAAAGGAVLWKRGAGTVAVTVNAPIEAEFQRLTDEAGVEERPSISPDGKMIAYQAGPFGKRDIFLRRVGGRNPVNLTEVNEGDDLEAAFSPDGTRIAFRSSRDGGGIFLMGATGESVRRLTDFGYSPSWSPDGKKIVCATEGVVDPMARPTVSQLWVINVETGEKSLLFKGDAVDPEWSPHDSRIAFWAVTGDSGQRDIWSIPSGGGDAGQITTSPAADLNPIWSPDGKYLYFSSDRGGSMNLWRVPVDEASGKAQGEPKPVTTPSLWSGFLSISQDGKHLVYTALDRRSNIQKLAFDPETETVTGSPIPITQGSTVFENPNVSPDGQWVTFRSSGKQEDIYVCRSDGKELRKLTDDAFRDRAPSFSPDGKRIVFYSDRTGRYEFWSINADGSGLQQITKLSERSLWYPRYSSDGSRLLGFNDADTVIFNVTQPLPWTKGTALPRPGEELVFQATSWSPDGKSLAGLSVLLSDSSAVPGILIYSFDSNQYTTLKNIIPDLRQSPIIDVTLWLNDNRRLLAINGGSIYVVDSQIGKARLLYGETGLAWLSLSRDNRWIYLNRQADEGDIWLATLN